MSSRAIRFLSSIGKAVCVTGVLSAALAWASVGGSISGTVKDPSGSIVANAQVTVRETGTGISYATHTDNKGYYTFPVLPVGHYVLDIESSGFSKYERKDIALDTSAALTLNAALEVGSVSQNVTVTDDTLHVEATSTQMGQVITGRQMTAV
ncbi:MAG: carboxypeptidase-like regulatory domain-containing protein, partial [Terracidiphilus sp.]